jgi:hypothetical protein
MLVILAYRLVLRAALLIVPVLPIIALITTYEMTSRTDPIIIARIEPTSNAVKAFRLRYLSRNIFRFTSLVDSMSYAIFILIFTFTFQTKPINTLRAYIRICKEKRMFVKCYTRILMVKLFDAVILQEIPPAQNRGIKIELQLLAGG